MFRPFAAAIAVATALSAPAAAQDASAGTVIATVNGAEITLGHMIAMQARLPDQYRQLPPEVLFDGILEQLINQAALAGTEDTLTPRAQLILDNERRALLASEAMAAMGDAALTEDALQEAYEETYGGAEPEEEYSAAHILVETEEKARELLEEISRGADFAQLAREHSTGPSGANGGDLGWFGKGMMVAEFESAVLSLAPGEVSEPVQTQFGWHVVKLNDVRQKDAPPLEDVRDELVANVRETAIRVAMAEARANADIVTSDLEGIDKAVIGDLGLLGE